MVDGIPLDGKILTGATIVAPGDISRETTRKSVSINYILRGSRIQLLMLMLFLKRQQIHFGREHFGNDFHTYSIVWTNSSIKFSVDGLEYGTDTGGFKQLRTIPNAVFWENGGTMAPFDQVILLPLLYHVILSKTKQKNSNKYFVQN